MTSINAVFSFFNPSNVDVSSSSTKKKNQQSFGSLTQGNIDVVGDFIGFTGTALSNFNGYFGRQSPVAEAALGLATPFSAINGVLNLKDGLQYNAAATKINDTYGKKLAKAQIAKAGVQASSALLSVPAKGLSLAACFTASKAVTTALRIFGVIGGSLVQVLDLLTVGLYSLKIDEMRKFKNELNSKPSKKALKHLQRLVRVRHREKKHIRKHCHVYREQEKRISQLLKRKQAYMARVANDSCIKLIRKAKPCDAEQILNTVLAHNTRKIALDATAVSIGVVGMISTVAALAFGGPLSLALIAGIEIIQAAGWLVLDAINLSDELKNSDKSEKGRYDKLLLLLGGAVALLALALITIFSSGLAPILLAGSACLFWITMSVICYLRLKKASP